MEILLTHPVGNSSGEAPTSSGQKKNRVLLKTGRLCLGWRWNHGHRNLLGSRDRKICLIKDVQNRYSLIKLESKIIESSPAFELLPIMPQRLFPQQITHSSLLMID